MDKYRHLPVEVEAMQFTGSFHNYDEICEWAGIDFPANTEYGSMPDGEPDFVAEMFIDTSRGRLRVKINDWIVKNNGEFYPCSPEVYFRNFVRLEGKVS
jgi:hypothetical protein